MPPPRGKDRPPRTRLWQKIHKTVLHLLYTECNDLAGSTKVTVFNHMFKDYLSSHDRPQGLTVAIIRVQYNERRKPAAADWKDICADIQNDEEVATRRSLIKDIRATVGILGLGTQTEAAASQPALAVTTPGPASPALKRTASAMLSEQSLDKFTSVKSRRIAAQAKIDYRIPLPSDVWVARDARDFTRDGDFALPSPPRTPRVRAAPRLVRSSKTSKVLSVPKVLQISNTGYKMKVGPETLANAKLSRVPVSEEAAFPDCPGLL